MATTQSPGTSIAYGHVQAEQFRLTLRKPGFSGDCISPALMDEVNPEMLDYCRDQFGLTGIDISYGEFLELTVLNDFLERHVQPIGIRDVQCMLLWSEWVRTFRRRMPGFPKLIREQEFRNIITNRFGITTTIDGTRGEVYPGIRFVP